MSSSSTITITDLTPVQKKRLEFFMEMTKSTDESYSLATLTSSNWDMDAAVLEHTMKISTGSDKNEGEKEEEDEEMDVDEPCDDADMDYEDDSDYESNTRSSSTTSGSLFPKDLEELPAALENFSAEFKKRYGASPPFFSGEFDDAIQLSKNSNRPILFFVTNDKSIASNVFISQIILNDNISQIISNNFILFPWDVTEEDHLERFVEEFDGYRFHTLSSFLDSFGESQVEAFPILLPLIRTSGDPDIPSFCQSSDSLDAVMAKLLGAADEFRLANRSQDALRREREEREQIRRLQEEEYQASLAADLARIAKMKEEEEKKKIEEERIRKEREEKQRLKDEELARQKKVAEVLPSEPAATEPGVMAIKFRLPGGKQAMRRFRQIETIQVLAMYLDSQGYSSEKYKYFNSDFPKKNVMEKFSQEQSFIDARWPAREQIFVEEI